ncbi:uncharacterized protein LOC144175564 [Haemaphysalis longicornis]
MFVLRKRKSLRKRKARSRSMWMRKMCRHRKSGHSATLIPLLTRSDTEYFFDSMRMSAATFGQLLSLVGHAVPKRNTNSRESIAATTRLEIMLRFLASGDSLRSLSYALQVWMSPLSKIISETSLAIWNNLKDEYVKCPRTECEWKSVARGFLQRWNNTEKCSPLFGVLLNHVTIIVEIAKFANYREWTPSVQQFPKMLESEVLEGRLSDTVTQA